MLSSAYKLTHSSPSAGFFKYLVQAKQFIRVVHNGSHRGAFIPVESISRKGFERDRTKEPVFTASTTRDMELASSLDGIQTVEINHDQNRRINESLEFLLGPGGAATQHSFFDEIVRSAHLSTESQQFMPKKNVSQSAETAELVKSTSRVVVEYENWRDQTEKLVKAMAWTDLTKYLRTSSVSGSVDGSYVSSLIDELFDRHQYLSVLYVFDEFEKRLLGQDIRIIGRTIKAALAARKHDYCGYLCETYSTVHVWPIEMLEDVLKSFISSHNLTEARAFLDQIWNQAREKTITCYIIGAVKIARNPREVMDVYKKWRMHNQDVSGLIYSLVLSGLYDLEAWTALELVLHDAYDCGKMTTPHLLGISIGRSMETEDWTKAESDIQAARKSGITIPERNFSRAAYLMALKGNDGGVAKCSELMISAGHKTSVFFLNQIGRGYSKFDKDFDAIKYLNAWGAFNLIGNVWTVRWIIAHFQKKYEQLADDLTCTFHDTLRNCPNLLNEFYLFELEASTQRSAPDNHGEGLVEYMRKMEHLVRAGKVERAFAHLNDLVRRGIRPPKTCFFLLIRSLGTLELWGPTDWLVDMMRRIDYKLEDDVQLRLLRLQKHLYSLRKSEENVINHTRVKERAESAIKQFFRENHTDLSLEGCTTLGMEAMRFRLSGLAVSLIDSKRAQAKFTLSNHDNVSIAEMVRAYKQASDFHGSHQMILTVINDGWQGMFNVGFFRQLKRIVKKIKLQNNHQLVQTFEELVVRCNAHNDVQKKRASADCEAICNIFKKWDQALEDRNKNEKKEQHVNK